MILNLLNGFEVQNSDVLFTEAAAVIVFYFAIYSLLGWLLENSYNVLTKGKFFKDNFLYGPFKPMYGISPILLVYLISPSTNWAVVLPLCFAVPTLIEYISGAMLHKLFGRQYWDYSETPMQLHGHICLPFSLCWGVLSLIVLKWIHPAIAGLYGKAEPIWAWIWPAVTLYFIADIVLTVRRHIMVPDTITNPDTINNIE
jgi:uncharacterized membrane protein